MEKFDALELKLKWFAGYMNAPEIKYLESGSCKTTFSIPLKKKKDDEPIWLNCQAWGKLAEKIAEYPKGSFVTVGGYFEEREYNGKTYLDFVVKVMM